MRFLRVAGLGLLFLISCSKKTLEIPGNAVIVAQVDDQKITETSFQRAYLPALLYGDKFDSPENRLEMLNFLIGQKILAEAARQNDLDSMTIVKRSTERTERTALARQLYQQWVREKLSPPSEAELREGFRRGKKSIFTRHLFAETEDEIRELAGQLASEQENFYTLAARVFQDTVLSKNGGALGWVTFGDLDETLEDTLYTLRPGQISAPVKSQYGWHILSMDDSQEDVFVTEEDYQKHKGLIRNKIIERRETRLGKEVLNDFMNRVDIEFNRDITRQVWPIVIEHLKPNEQGDRGNLELGDLNSRLALLWDETLLEANGQAWTVGQILRRFPELDRSLLYGNLYIAASNVIRDEMLVQEARRLGLDQDYQVRQEVQDMEDQVLADTYVSLIADTLHFTEAHQRAFYDAHRLDRYHAPDSLHLEVYLFTDSLTAHKALYQLRSAVISTDPADDSFWISGPQEQPDMYRITRSISTGTMAGPIRYQGKWALIKLLERLRFPLPFPQIASRIAADMERERFNTARNILLNELKPGHTIKIHENELNRK